MSGAQARGPARAAASRPRRLLRVAVWRLRRLWQLAEFGLARRFGLATPEDRRFFLAIPAVGVVAGVLGILLHLAIGGFERLLWGRDDSLLAAVAGSSAAWRIVAPGLGGLVVALIVWVGRQQVAGAGMSTLIEAVARRGGEVPPRPVVLRALAAVATVGAGGSLGREGPMIRLGAMISSQLALRLRLAPHRVKVLVGCGAAAGLAAAYNIPVGGALFAMEVILGNFALEIFGPIVVSSVVSTLIARSVEGDFPVYPAPGYQLESGWEILAYAGLGLTGALSSVLFVFAVRWGGRGFAALRFLPEAFKPVLGMALVGALALALPHVVGSGVEAASLAVAGELPLGILLALPAAKLLATALTAGGGGAGGLFTPALTFGALVGSAYGYSVHQLFPELTAPYGAYAAVGMAAVAAGTSHAPISAILILFEFTGNYDLILPLMVAAILSGLLSRRLFAYSIYTEPLHRQGIELRRRFEEAALAGLAVKDLVREDREQLSPGAGYKEVVERFLATRRSRLFVVASDGRLVGAVSLHDIKGLLDDPGAVEAVLADDLAAPVAEVLTAAERLDRAAEILARSDHERLPVLEGPAGRYLGYLAKRDVLAVYAQEVLGRPALLATFVSAEGGEMARDYVELPPDFAVRAVALPAALVGRTLAEARLPQEAGVRVLEIRRRGPGGEARIVPGATTVLGSGDELVVLGPRLGIERLERGEGRFDEAAAHAGID